MIWCVIPRWPEELLNGFIDLLCSPNTLNLLFFRKKISVLRKPFFLKDIFCIMERKQKLINQTVSLKVSPSVILAKIERGGHGAFFEGGGIKIYKCPPLKTCNIFNYRCSPQISRNAPPLPHSKKAPWRGVSLAKLFIKDLLNKKIFRRFAPD